MLTLNAKLKQIISRYCNDLIAGMLAKTITKSVLVWHSSADNNLPDIGEPVFINVVNTPKLNYHYVYLAPYKSAGNMWHSMSTNIVVATNDHPVLWCYAPIKEN